MSFELAFTDRALDGLKRLEIWLQEETLDELDRIAADPPDPNPHLAGAAICDFVRQRGTEKHYVFITVIPDANSGRLQISEIGGYIRRVS